MNDGNDGNSAIGTRGVILYDANCGTCSRLAQRWTPTVMQHGYTVAALQEPWVAARFPLSAEVLLRDVRLLRPDRSSAAGAEVYLDIARHIWWAWPVYAVFSLPGFKQVLEKGYRWVADNRHRISSACKVQRTSRQ